MGQSIATSIELTHSKRDQLAIHFPQPLGACHRRAIERYVSFQPFEVQGVDPKDLVHPTGLRIEQAVVDLTQRFGSARLVDDADESHSPITPSFVE